MRQIRAEKCGAGASRRLLSHWARTGDAETKGEIAITMTTTIDTVLEKVTTVDGQPVTLYSRDNQHWASSVADIIKWEQARARRQQRFSGDHRAIFNPVICGRKK